MIYQNKSSLFCVLVHVWPFLPMGITEFDWFTSCSAISKQLVAGSIIATHKKLISVPSLPSRVYSAIRSRQSTSQGFDTTSLVGNLPYLCWYLLLTWHLWLFLTCIVTLSNKSQHNKFLLNKSYPDVASIEYVAFPLGWNVSHLCKELVCFKLDEFCNVKAGWDFDHFFHGLRCFIFQDC